MRIACVHQGYELYGSDRSFAECVSAMRRAYPAAEIEVVLPQHGPIVALLENIATRIVFEPVWVLRRRNLLRLMTIGILRLPGAIMRAARRFQKFDLVYINTSVIADYALVARFFRHRALVHVHEIPEGATLKVLRCLVRWSGAEIIFNSQATSSAFSLLPGSRSTVIYNGVAGPPQPEPMAYDGQRPLRLLLLGRVNRIKGQDILAMAVSRLPPDLRARVAVRMVGSAFEDQGQEAALAALVRQLGLANVVMEPFTADAAPLYRWADIVVVPSQRPESLGRVGIEAMSFGRPVIASRIGGLAEVVADGCTGWLVPPGDADALAKKLAGILQNPAEWRGYGVAGRHRYEAVFSEDIAARAIVAVVAAKLSANAPLTGLTPEAGRA